MLSLHSAAQTTIIGNNSSTSTDYLGWDAMTTFDLNVKHEGNRNILFSTNNTLAAGILNSGYVLAGTVAPLDNGLLSVQVPGTATIKYAIYSVASGTMPYGGIFLGDNSVNNVGLAGTAESSSTLVSNYGIFGNACVAATNGFSAGVYGIILPPCSGASWAGYFDGKTFCTAGSWSGSDAMLKTNIAPLTGCRNILGQLSPKQYNFIQPDGVEINLPQGLQYGLLAQDLQLVVPHAVTEVAHGMRLESMRLGLDQEFNFLGVNYTQLIPVLIGAFQERQLEIYSEMESLIELQQLVEEAELAAAILLAE
jgi:hypothetical protein